jgi:hypothetical protein
VLTPTTLRRSFTRVSRGLGKRERQVLETLSELGQPALSGLIKGDEYWYLESLCEEDSEDKFGWAKSSRSEVESVRRAVRSLRRKGLVETRYKADGVECIRLEARLTSAGRDSVA